MKEEIKEQISPENVEKPQKTGDEKPATIPISAKGVILLHLLFFLLGICRFLPTTFLGAANNYWMHKFRNTSDPTDSAENRTFMQQNFASATMIFRTIPMLLFGIFNITHAHRYKIMSRILITFSIELGIFLFLTASSRIDTDNFQLGFFVMVLAAYVILSGANTVNILGTMNLYPRFPQKFMKTSLVGEGMAGIIGDLLNILSVYIYSDNITSSTLMYFICGSFIIGFTLFLNIVMTRQDFFRKALEAMPSDAHHKKLPAKEDLKRAFRKMELILVAISTSMVSMIATHTAVTSLVVSEQDTSTSSWAKNYFSPVVTFLMADCAMLIGRLISSYLPIKLSEKKCLILTFSASISLVPLIWLCNAQPRSHLPVVFTHDYQYGIIFGIFMICNGYIMNQSFLLIAGKTTPEEADMAYTILGLSLSIIQTIFSPVGIFVVNVL